MSSTKLVVESPEWHQNYQEMIQQLEEIARLRAKGTRCSLSILSDPRRMRRRFYKQLIADWNAFLAAGGTFKVTEREMTAMEMNTLK